MDESIQPGWDDEREGYACRDGAHFHVQRRTANVRDLDKTKTVPRNIIMYTASKRDVRAAVFGVMFGRDMEKVLGGPDDIRTMIFPNMVKSIR